MDVDAEGMEQVSIGSGSALDIEVLGGELLVERLADLLNDRVQVKRGCRMPT
jgi:hypothetical protein